MVDGGLPYSKLCASGTPAVTIEHTLASRPALEVCHAAGLRVLVWTVDDPRRMRALLAMGVDGITTNAVDVLVSGHRPLA